MGWTAPEHPWVQDYNTKLKLLCCSANCLALTTGINLTFNLLVFFAV
jgi:hypothetical protein